MKAQSLNNEVNLCIFTMNQKRRYSWMSTMAKKDIRQLRHTAQRSPHRPFLQTICLRGAANQTKSGFKGQQTDGLFQTRN